MTSLGIVCVPLDNKYDCTCILKTHSHRLCNNNIIDVAQEVMLHMQHILPKGKNTVTPIEIQLKCPHVFARREIQQVSYYSRNGTTWVSCPRADVSLGLRPRDNIQPLCNITHVAPFLG